MVITIGTVLIIRAREKFFGHFLDIFSIPLSIMGGQIWLSKRLLVVGLYVPPPPYLRAMT